MLMIGISIKGIEIGFNLSCGDFSIPAVKRHGFVACIFDSTGFVNSNMPCLRTKHAFIGAEHCCYDCFIGLGASDQKIDVGIRGITCGQDFLCGLHAVMITFISGKLFHIGSYERLEDFGVGSFYIITRQIQHDKTSYFLFFRDGLKPVSA